MSYTIDYQTTGADLCFTGFVSGQEILEAKREFFRHAPGDTRYVICDFTDASKFDIPSSDLNRIVDQDRAQIETHPALLEAVIAPQPLVYGLSRMWQAKVNGVRPHAAVLRGRGEAVEWLRAAGIAPAAVHCATGAATEHDDDIRLLGNARSG